MALDTLPTIEMFPVEPSAPPDSTLLQILTFFGLFFRAAAAAAQKKG
jgi:hypothetical protein